MYVWYVRSPEWSLSPPMTIPRGAQNGKIEGNNIWYSYAHIDGDGKTWTVAANANTPSVINDNMKQTNRFWVQMEIVCSHVWISNQTIWMTDQNVERIEWNNWTLKTCITWEWEVICFCFFFCWARTLMNARKRTKKYRTESVATELLLLDFIHLCAAHNIIKSERWMWRVSLSQ